MSRKYLIFPETFPRFPDSRPNSPDSRNNFFFLPKQPLLELSPPVTFMPIIALATLKVVLLQLNGMLIMWKIQQAMYARQYHPDHQNSSRFHPDHRAYRDIGLEKRRSRQLSQPPLSCEHIENLQRIRRGQPGQPGLM